jgi:hypothetical protein
VATANLPKTAAEPFYHRLNELLDEHGFDARTSLKRLLIHVGAFNLSLVLRKKLERARIKAWRR